VPHVLQLVSSAIGYNPPAPAISKVLDQYSGYAPSTIVEPAGGKPGLYQTVAWLFRHKPTRPSISARFSNRNNFCELSVSVANTGTFAKLPILHATYHVRKGIMAANEMDMTAFPITIPPLLPLGQVTPAVTNALQEKCIGHIKPPKPPNMCKRYCCFACVALME
jgi:hypothetical protein